MIAEAGLVGIHLASGQPRVVPPGGTRPALGTNPLCFGFPSAQGAVIFDMGTAALQWGEVMLHAHLGMPLPEGVGLDKDGQSTRDAGETLLGGVLPFGGTKASACLSWYRLWAFWQGPHSPEAGCRIMGFSSSRSTPACWFL
jgi:delta1-piperideine-2-carboxylate reductase